MIKKRDICVVCAEDVNEIGEHVLQLVTKARMLHTEGGGVVTVLCAGYDTAKALEPLFIYGGHKVIASKRVPQNRYEYADSVVQMLSMCDPELILFPSSDWGETSAAYAAICLQAGLTANCMNISIDGGNYIFTRAAINGTVFAQIAAYHTNIAICTVQRNAFSKMRFQERDKYLSAQIIDIGYKMPFPTFDVLESKSVPAWNRVENLDHAKLVFGFGRGLGGGEALQILHKVAAEYKAEIVGTRAVRENGLIEKSRQVGQSGISIAPSIYVAFGISGASQHMVGVMNARRIIAVNTDPNAPIISFSSEVIIEDCKTILNKLSVLNVQNQ
jgi:electron transfer flavoprotein alpha subunit